MVIISKSKFKITNLEDLLKQNEIEISSPVVIDGIVTNLFITTFGNIYSVINDKINYLNPVIDRSGYARIKIEIDNTEVNNSKRKIYITDEEVLKKYSLSIENKNNTSSEKNYNQNIINYNNKINNKGPIISYDTDGVMLWNGKRCESEEATLEEMKELELLLSEFKGDSNE